MASEPRPPLLGRKKLVAFANETVSGTLVSLTTPIAANTYGIKMKPGSFFGEGEREPFGNYMGSVAAVLGKQSGDVEFDLDISPTGPFLGLTLLAGYVASTGTYAPNSNLANRTTYSVACWEDGRVKKLSGVAGNITIDLECGKKAVAHVKGSGIWQGVTDASMPAQSPITALPYICQSITVTSGAVAMANINKISIDLGANAEPRESITSAYAIAHYLVSEIEPKITMDPEARKVADQDAYGIFLAGGTAAIVVVLTSGGHTLTITAPAAQRTSVSDGMRGKRLTDELQLACRVSSGEDALQMVET